MLGYSEEELAERTPLDITHPHDVERSRRLAEDMLRDDRSSALEKRYLRKNGEVVWARRTGCVVRDEDGRPRHFLIMIDDISQRKRAEEALRESKRELELALHANQLIMDNSQDVICTIDAAGRFVTLNAACENLWGYTPAELLGREYIDLIHPDDRQRSEEAAAEILSSGRLSDFVNRYVRKDGSVVDVLWSASWSETDGKLFCVAHDVTERARNEKALREAKEEADRANHAKSEFLSRMSHELRTPLNAILGFGQLLQRQGASEAQSTRAGHIVKAGRHLLDLINEVLDISRIDAGNFQVSLEPVCVAHAISAAIDLVRPMATERGIEILPNASAYHVLADQQRLKQVLLNFLSNAVKYTPCGGIVTVSATDVNNAVVRISVSDSGQGIADDKLTRLFTPFDRLGAEQSGVEGTGLGLALSQRLVQAMDGTIGASSEFGTGSTFWIELPLSAAPAVLRENENAPAAIDSRSERRTLLYIEDNLSNLSLMEQLLAEFPNVELLTAMQGSVGFDLARQHRPHVILLDLHLPDIPGWQVLERLRGDAATRQIPVIIISADATARQTQKLLAAGAQRYLTKPIDLAEFTRALDEITPRAA
jgi:PAS domain S-box-containing protein